MCFLYAIPTCDLLFPLPFSLTLSSKSGCGVQKVFLCLFPFRRPSPAEDETLDATDLQCDQLHTLDAADSQRLEGLLSVYSLILLPVELYTQFITNVCPPNHALFTNLFSTEFRSPSFVPILAPSRVLFSTCENSHFSPRTYSSARMAQ